MIRGKTRTGFEFEYSKKVLESMRIVEALANMERGGGQALIGTTDLLTTMLGDEQKEAFYKHLESLDPDGIASMDAMKDELEDMFNAGGDESKN